MCMSRDPEIQAAFAVLAASHLQLFGRVCCNSRVMSVIVLGRDLKYEAGWNMLFWVRTMSLVAVRVGSET